MVQAAAWWSPSLLLHLGFQAQTHVVKHVKNPLLLFGMLYAESRPSNLFYVPHSMISSHIHSWVLQKVSMSFLCLFWKLSPKERILVFPLPSLSRRFFQYHPSILWSFWLEKRSFDSFFVSFISLIVTSVYRYPSILIPIEFLEKIIQAPREHQWNDVCKILLSKNIGGNWYAC